FATGQSVVEMLKIFLGILAVILAVALLTNKSDKPVPAMAPVPAASQQAGDSADPAAPVAMNPPHGQPGHRCDIAVGAPLPAASSAAGPAPDPQDFSPKKEAVAVNPPHGQPGHDCAVPVGAPLPSK